MPVNSSYQKAIYFSEVGSSSVAIGISTGLFIILTHSEKPRMTTGSLATTNTLGAQ